MPTACPTISDVHFHKVRSIKFRRKKNAKLFIAKRIRIRMRAGEINRILYTLSL